MTERWTDGVADLRCGRWQDALADVERVDCVCVDAPYSAKTHGGHDGAPTVRRSGIGDARYETFNSGSAKAGRPSSVQNRRAIEYGAWTDDDVCDFVDGWAPRCAGWFVTITDHTLGPVWAARLESHGFYSFAPIPWIAPGSRVRLSGDGPSGWTCWIIVARPRVEPFTKWGTLPGFYNITSGSTADRRAGVVGGKPIRLMRALVRDYTRPGDLVCDPCAGGATTLRAAQLEGRRAIGAEMDPDTYAKAVERLAAPYTPALRMDVPTATQAGLFEVEA